MNPNVKKLPKSVRTLICASNQINSFTKAVQELVFNALDADATSIAVRIHIAEGSIQVVDNGSGISKADFKYIGQNYMTSKLADLSNLKSAPNKYGFQGQSLAHLAQISETMRVVSRFSECEITCIKTFEKGKAKVTTKCSPRPSKGTTVEIKGFLFNLKIQKKSVVPMSELQNVKTFLEHLSLVHSSISLSLRDDSKNEIVYKIHKNRDMYQTLSTLYDIDKSNIQELQIEKNQYKLKAFVGKNDVEISKQLIFLNGKTINERSLLHKKVNDNFRKHLRGINKKIKKNVNNDEETHLFGNNIPVYFIFITCPYIDYEMTNTVLEFKDWGQISTILEKLVKFYMGETQLQPIPKNQITAITRKKITEKTRNHIEKIMHKILGSRNKKPAISQMQNGIKGKLIKRKPKNKKGVSKILNSSVTKRQEILNLGLNVKELTVEQTDKDDSTTTKVQPHRSATDGNKFSVSQFTKISNKNTHESLKKKESLNGKNKLPKRLHRNKLLITKRNNKQNGTKIYLNDKFALETESVKQRCKLLAEETDKLIKKNETDLPEMVINKNVHYTSSNFVHGNKNIAIRAKVNEILIREYIPLPPKKKQNENGGQFKSNYDLLQTIINTQQESRTDKSLEQFVPNTGKIEYDNKVNDVPLKTKLSDKCRIPLLREVNEDNLTELGKFNNNISLFVNEPSGTLSIQNGPYDNLSQESDVHDVYRSIPLDTPDDNLSLLKHLNHTSPLQTNTLDSNILPYLIKSSSDTSPFQAVTFQSHNYEQMYQSSNDTELRNFNKKPRTFMTSRSMENFYNYPKNNNFKMIKVELFSEINKPNHQKRKWNKSFKLFDVENNTAKGTTDSYTIEFSKSKEYEYTSMNNLDYVQEIIYSPPKINEDIVETITPVSNIQNDCLDQYTKLSNPDTWIIPTNTTNKLGGLHHKLLNENTYTICKSNTDSKNRNISLNYENWYNNETFTVEFPKKTYLKHLNEPETDESLSNNENTSYIFVSKSQENEDGRQITDPIAVCETILSDQESSIDRELEFDISFNCKQNTVNDYDAIGNNHYEIRPPHKLNNAIDNLNTSLSSFEKNTLNQDEIIETSHHFTRPNINVSKCKSQHSEATNDYLVEKIPLEEPNACIEEPRQNKDAETVSKVLNEQHDIGAFTLKNRMCFVPKGMSPIFKKCQTKITCDYDTNEDYYADEMYDDFLKKVQNDTEIFKPGIRDTSELITKYISKINHRQNGDECLKFDGQCIKNAKVLGQVDNKFIAAVMKSKSHESEDLKEFLVLFDQHAVHERIRLENNLADYLVDSQWKSVAIDEVFLKMSRDEILYLHNYRDKFTQFGLQWSIINQTEMSITAIPEGILGKNPRQVDKIIKAVKSLIREGIHNIQMQRGCVSIYPKSIMNLIFSEACRYAIKFGDYLTKSRCKELLHELSACKTPFQCAHGRPSMAVIMNIESNKIDYKINFKKIQQFKEFNLDKLP